MQPPVELPLRSALPVGARSSAHSPAVLSLVVTLAAALLCIFPTHARAQLPLSGNGNSEQTDVEKVEFGEIIEALGRWLVNAIHAEDSTASVESPRWNGNSSPREALMTFLENVGYLRLGQEQSWSRVRAILPPDETLSTRDKAHDLARVFDRLGEVPAHRLASAEEVESQGIQRYRVFPGAVDHVSVWRALDAAPAGQIVLLRGEDGNWRFSPATLENVEELLESIATIPPRTNAQVPSSGLPPFFDSNVLPDRRADWWIVSALGLLGVALAFGLYWGMRKLAEDLSGKRHAVARVTLDQLASPVASLAVLIALVVASSTLALHPAVSQLRWQITGLAFLLVLAFFLYRLVPVFGEGLEVSGSRHVTGTAVPLLVRILQVLLVIITLAIVLESLFSVNVAGLIAGFGILGLALGLAAQESVRNWFGAATIYLAKPFTRGDWIIYNGDYAHVESIGLNATKLRMASGELLTVPNMKFIDQEVENTTERPYLRREMNIAIPYDTTPDRMEEVIEAVREALGQEEVIEEGQFGEVGREPHITFRSFEEDHLLVRAYYWFHVEPGESGWYEFLEHCDTVNRALLRVFSDREMAFAFPTRTLRLMNHEGSLRASVEESDSKKKKDGRE